MAPRILKDTYRLWDEACQHVTTLEEKWSDYWEPYHRWCRLIFRLYMAKNEWTTLGTRARLSLSLPFTIIETVAAETYRALFDEQPYFKQKPVGAEDVELAETVSLYTANQMDRNHTRIRGYMFEKNRLLFGLSWAGVPWTLAKEWKRRDVPLMEEARNQIVDEFGRPAVDEDGKPQSKPVINPWTGKPVMVPRRDMFGKPMTEKKFVKETTKDIWELKPYYPWQVLSDPSITDPFDIPSGGEGVILHQYMSSAELWRMQRDGIYQNVDKFFNREEEDAGDGGRTSFDVPQEDEETAQDLNEGYSYKRHLLHVKRFMGKFPARAEIKNGRETMVYDESAEPVECFIDTLDGECLRAIRNPIDEQIRPMIAAQCHPIADHLVSPGLLQAVESEIREVQTFKNIRLDNITQKMNPMYEVRFGSQVAKRDLRYHPGKKIPVSMVGGDVKEFASPELGQGYDRSLAEMSYDVQNATNALNASQGASNVGQAFGRTAAGINFFQNRMQHRLQVIVDVGEEQMFGSLSDLVNSYNAQFLKNEQKFAVLNRPNPYLAITPEAFMNRRDMIPVGASRKLNKGQLMQIADRIITEAGVLKDFVKIDWFIKEMVKAMEITPNPDDVLYTDEEKQKMAANQPPDVKKGLNISINWADLEPGLKAELTQKLMGVRPEEMQAPQEPLQLPAGMPPQGMPMAGGMNA